MSSHAIAENLGIQVASDGAFSHQSKAAKMAWKDLLALMLYASNFPFPTIPQNVDPALHDALLH